MYLLSVLWNYYYKSSVVKPVKMRNDFKRIEEKYVK